MRIACSKLFCVYSKCLRQIVSTNMSNSTQFSRLPSNVVPVHYDLEIKPNLEKFTFEGKVAVNFEVSEGELVNPETLREAFDVGSRTS